MISTSAGTRPSARGFTLVELLVVIAIIGVLVGLLLPALKPGAYDVVVSSSEERYDARGNSAGFRSLLPEKYTSVKTGGLSATVDAGHRTMTFEVATSRRCGRNCDSCRGERGGRVDHPGSLHS